MYKQVLVQSVLEQLNHLIRSICSHNLLTALSPTTDY